MAKAKIKSWKDLLLFFPDFEDNGVELSFALNCLHVVYFNKEDRNGPRLKCLWTVGISL